MRKATKSELNAVFYSPLAAGPGMFLGGLIHDSSIIANQEWWLTLMQPFYFILLSFPISYGGMLILGVPLYIILKWVRLGHPLVISVAGLPLGYLVYRVLEGGSEYSNEMWLYIFVVSSFFVSSVAALILGLGKESNKKTQPTANASAG